MSATKYIITIALSALTLLSVVAVINYNTDPMCYYHCDNIDTSLKTQNVYYQSTQVIGANPDAEIIILGSSRGETTPAQWVSQYTGEKTINLSKGGAGIMFKTALLRIAKEKELPLKKVIWIADYFEISGNYTDVKVRQTKVLSNPIKELLPSENTLKGNFEFFQRLIDHNTLEASLEFLKDHDTALFEPLGSGSGIDFEKCLAPDFAGRTKPENLMKEIEITYSTFSPLLALGPNEHFSQTLKNEIAKQEYKDIHFIILVPPFNPTFMARLYKEHPQTEALHRQWLEMLQDLKAPNVTVASYWDGIPNDDGSPSYWDDGAHPTCKSMIEMIKAALSKQ